jgi:hypothetical protein
MSLLLLPFNIFRFANGAQDTMLCSIVLWGSLWYVSSPVGGWVVGCWVLGGRVILGHRSLLVIACH